jgi:ATP/maltotriose-dependent transcriptional regulator MalT/DNA-binding SARP family transcriptional activator
VSQPSVAFAKTTRPAIGSVLNRERLFSRLDGSPGRTLAWICGPPGSGKTTLAASYVQARGLRCLWYQVDPDDADVATFFHYLGHASRKLGDGGAATSPAFGPQYAADVGPFARRYFRELFARAKGPFALVLDNLHAVPPESALHAVLEAAFGQIPKHCCAIVTSRGDPPAALARLRVTGEMTVVGWEALRVEPAELAEIARLRGHELAPEAAAQLESRARGWAAGLVLMLEHAKLSGRIAELPDGAAPQAIFDYLAGEIFERFEPKTRQFLLRIACLPRMSAEVAQSLSGEPKAARLLLNLALNHYFVAEAQSDEGRVFQLHPLLREFLRSRAAHELPEALAPETLKRAASLLRAAGQVEDAVALLAECRDWDEVARIAALQADAMLAQGRSETLGGWLELVPARVLEKDPALLRALGACRRHASPRAARRLFEQAFEAYRRAGDLARMAECCCGLIDATILEFDDLAPLEHWAGVLSRLLEDGALGGSAGRESAAAETLAWALLWRDPGSARLDAWLARAGSPLARAAAALLRGDLAVAGATLEALDPASRALAPHDAAALGVAGALRHFFLGEHAEARRSALDALERGGATAVHAYDGWLRAIVAAAALGAGDRDAARGELGALEASGAAQRRGDRAIVHYLRGWLAWLEGDSAGAQRDAKAAAALAVECGAPWLECFARAALAQVLAEGGDRRAADAQLRAAEALSERLASALAGFAISLARAGAAMEGKDEAAALAPIRHAFAAAREHGLQHAPWWRARQAAELCAVALRHGIEPEFARALVRARGLQPKEPPLRVTGWPWRFRIRALGRFELLRDERSVELSGKGPGRPMELLKVLIALGGQNVRADHIADALWPHVDADYAHKSFTATLHRLRRLFGEDEALVLRDGRLSLNAALVWVDTWALEQAISAADERLRAPPDPAGAPGLQGLADELLGLYRGPYLPDESEQPSYIACREEIRARLLRCLTRVARRWEEAGRREAAAECYLRLIEADGLFEGPYRNLMLCYQRSGDLVEARATYERLRTILAARLKSAPSAETQAVFASLA